MPGYVSPATAVTGVLTDTLLNSYKAGLDTLAGPARAVLVQSSAGTSVANSATVWTPIAWDTEVADTVNGWVASPHPTRYTAQPGWAGGYAATLKILYPAATVAVRGAAFQINGGTPMLGSGVFRSDSAQVLVSATWEFFLNVGDYVEGVGLQNSGGALTTAIGAVTTSSLVIHWLGNS